MKKVAIISAIESEQKLLREKFSDRYLFFYCGVGPFTALIETEKFLVKHHHSIEKLIFCGTAGAYGNSSIQIGDILTVKHSQYASVSIAEGKSYTPDSLQKQKLELVPLLTFNAVNCLTVTEIICHSESALKMRQFYQADIENMELHSVVIRAREFQIPVSALMAVSNYVGENAHNEWLKYHQEVSTQLNKLILNKQL